jgi:hypothetical protein
MFRFTIRDWLWLTAVVVVGATVFAMPSQRENDRRPITRRASEQEMATINVRYEAAKGEFEWHTGRTRGTGIFPSADERCDAIERFAKAAEARNDLEARIIDLAEVLKFVQSLASSTLDKYENDVEPASEVYRFQYTRADIEARLRRAEQDLAVGRVTR